MGSYKRSCAIAAAAALVLGFAYGPAAQAGDYLGNWYVDQTGAGGEGDVYGTAFLMGADGNTLTFACDKGGLTVEMTYLKAFPVEVKSVPVQWRADAGAPRRESWTVGSDRGTLSGPAGEPARALMAGLARAHSLTITAEARRSRFDVRGARQVEALMGRCGKAPG